MNDLSPNKASQVRAGFTRAGHSPETPQPDWNRFARHIAAKFDPDSSPELMGAACTLLVDPQEPGFLRERRTEPSLWEPSILERNTAWLAEVVQHIRDRLLLQINFAQEPACDDASLTAALLLVQAWASLDPTVQRLLARGL